MKGRISLPEAAGKKTACTDSLESIPAEGVQS